MKNKRYLKAAEMVDSSKFYTPSEAIDLAVKSVSVFNPSGFLD